MMWLLTAYGAAMILGAIVFAVCARRAPSTDDEPVEMPRLDETP